MFFFIGAVPHTEMVGEKSLETGQDLLLLDLI
jgi:hypothetical protein